MRMAQPIPATCKPPAQRFRARHEKALGGLFSQVLEVQNKYLG